MNKQELYLLIKTGYEGIEELCYLSDSSSTILEKRKEFITKNLVEEKELWKDECTELREEMVSSEQEVADFFCVQHWDGEKFACVCSKLGVSPSKLMLR